MKKSAASQLERLAKESEEAKNRVAPINLPPGVTDKLEAYRRNIGKIVVLPLSELALGENVRKYVLTDTEDFKQLVASIEKGGINQNLVADLRIEEDGTPKLNIVAGQRRYLAGLEAGVKSCPVKIMQFTDRASRIAEGLSENLLRDNLHYLDQAEGYFELLREGWTESQIAETFDRKRQTIMQLLRLARFPDEAKKIIRQNMAEFTSFDLLNKFVARSWKDTPSLVAALKAHLANRANVKNRPKTDERLRTIGKNLSAKSGYRISVSGTSGTGQVTIKWSDERQQKALFELLQQISSTAK